MVLDVLVVSSVYAAYKYWAGRGAAAAVGVERNYFVYLSPVKGPFSYM
jgi:hypothetical protein